MESFQTMDLVMLAGMAVVAIGLVAYSLWPSSADKEETVKRRTAGLTASEDMNLLHSKAKQRATNANMLAMAAQLSKPVMPKNVEEQSTLKAKLANAGYRNESAPVMFLASKTVGGVACGLVGLLWAVGADKETRLMIYAVVFGLGVGFMLPNLWLGQVVRKRVEAVRNGLADSLDLMVIAVESGLGLDAAMMRVSDEMSHVHPQLAEEFQISIIETQMGTARSEALTKMADRTAVPEMRALVAIIVQAEKLGTSIARALRNQAESLRTKRRQKAEERAQKTAVKLLIPLILFIFPAIFVVLAGPAAIHLMKTFSNLQINH